MADIILGQFPFGYPDMNYGEVFGGGGAILAAKFPSPAEVYNDINTELTTALKVIQTKKIELAERMCDSFSSKVLFHEFKDEPDPTKLPDVERAFRFLYLSHMSFSGSCNSWQGVDGFLKGQRILPGLLKSPWADKVWDKPKQRTMDELMAKLSRFSDRLKVVAIYCSDFRDIIKRFDAPNTLFYFDPPYFHGGEQYGAMYGFPEDKKWTLQDHKDLNQLMRKMQGLFLLSIDDCPEAMELYAPEFKTFHFEVSYSFGPHEKKVGKELLVYNYEKTMGGKLY